MKKAIFSTEDDIVVTSGCLLLKSIRALDFTGEIFYSYVLCGDTTPVEDSFIGETGTLDLCIKSNSLIILGTEAAAVAVETNASCVV